MKTTRLGSIFTAIFVLAVAITATAQNSSFLRESPIAWMDETDRAIFRTTVESVLRAPDGTATDWLNPDTGSKGKVKVLDTHEDLGTTCRSIRMRNETKSRTGGGVHRLCLAEDGEWKFAPNKSD